MVLAHTINPIALNHWHLWMDKLNLLQPAKCLHVPRTAAVVGSERCCIIASMNTVGIFLATTVFNYSGFNIASETLKSKSKQTSCVDDLLLDLDLVAVNQLRVSETRKPTEKQVVRGSVNKGYFDMQVLYWAGHATLSQLISPNAQDPVLFSYWRKKYRVAPIRAPGL